MVALSMTPSFMVTLAYHVIYRLRIMKHVSPYPLPHWELLPL